MSECGVKNSQGKAWPEYSVYLRKSYDFGAWQKGSQACTYIGKLCYDDNYIKSIAMSEGTAGLDKANTFQNGEDNNQVEKINTIYFDQVAQCFICIIIVPQLYLFCFLIVLKRPRS